MAEVEIWLARRTASGEVITMPLLVEPADRHAAGIARKAATAWAMTAAPGLLQLFRLAPREGTGEPTPDELSKATRVDNTIVASNRDVFSEGAWFRLDVIDMNTPQGGKSNPHARDAGARAWREMETPLRFRPPLARRRRRPLPLTRPPLRLRRPPFGVAGGSIGAGAGGGGGSGSGSGGGSGAGSASAGSLQVGKWNMSSPAWKVLFSRSHDHASLGPRSISFPPCR
jgi:hypothetical protein